MICIDALLFMREKNSIPRRRLVCGVLMLVSVAALSACSNKEKAGQALVRVNGEEITMLQVNEELKQAGIQAEQQEAASKQLLESLIDRQLILTEAATNKMDRTPDVMQAIERAKAQIITQAYLQDIISKIPKPSRTEISDYFQSHPEFFSKRKQFDLQQLVIANKDYNDALKLFISSAKSLDEVAAWMDKYSIPYTRGQATRTSADLPPQVVTKLLELSKGQLFLVEERDSKMLNMLIDFKDSPVTALNAAPQIEQFLINKKNKEAVEVEVAHLRSLAKIEYLNASAPVAVQAPATVPDDKAASSVVTN
ncbi:MAG: EpsD family peptidyl-prolyl cis-trans isomerase [Gallionella sp.]